MNKPEKQNEEHFKDSCNHAISITKTLLSYSSAGIAFIISIIVGGLNFCPTFINWLSIGSFSLSIILGLFFLMNVVGHINQFANYNVNLPRLRYITIFQMLSFLIPILLIGFYTLTYVPEKDSEKGDYIELKHNGVSVRKELNKNDSINVFINNTKIRVEK